MKTPREILSSARVIAVVGCSNSPARDSHRIAEYLMRQGYTVYPVNPTIDTALGMKCYPDLLSVPEPIDIVNVFRNPIYVMPIVEHAIAVDAKAIWFQLGVINPSAERRAIEAGLDVVTDRCIAVDHRILGIPRVGVHG